MKLTTGKTGKRGAALLGVLLLLLGAAAGLSGCSKSDIVEYEHDGFVVPFTREFYKNVELTPKEELGEGVLAEVYDRDGVFLFRLLAQTQGAWERGAIEACREGGSVKAFARKEDTVYVVEGPSAEQAGGAQAGEEELPDGGEQAQQEGELPGLLERIRQTNGLEEFEPHLYEQPYLVLFAASGAAKQSWSDVEELPPEYLCDFFPDAYVWEGGDLTPYLLRQESGMQQYLVPSDVFEGLLMRYFDVTPELLRAMPQYDADKNAYLAASGTKPQTHALAALFCEEGQDGLLTLRYYASIEGQEDGLREVTVRQTGEKSYRYVSFVSQDDMAARRYYDYFEQHSSQLNPLFSLPSGDQRQDDENLMIFALQNMPLPSQEEGVSKQSIDEVLIKYFGHTVTDYETDITRELPSGNITWDGFSFHGTVRLVQSSLQQQEDGSKKGVFEVYQLPEDDLAGYGGYESVLLRLRQGQTQGLEKLYAGELTLVFEEVEDPEEPLGFYVRYDSMAFRPVSQTQEQSLYFYNGALLGSFDGQSWYSLCDLGEGGQQSYAVSADSAPRIYTANDVLAAPIYYLFEEGVFTGHSDWLIWPVAVGGLGEFESPQANDILAQAGTLWESEEFGSREFYRMQLPGTLYEESAALRIPDYSFVTYFGESVGQKIAGGVGEDVSLLVTNANHDLTAVQVQELDLSQCGVDDAVVQLFRQAGMENTRPNLVRAQQGDFDADGEPETLYTLVSPKDGGGWPLMEGEGTTGDVGTFALLLYEDKELQVVFSDLRPWHNGEEVTFENGIFPVSDIDYCHDVEVSAVADLDGDGDCELVVTCSRWEGGYTMVFSQDEQGRYEAVMRSNWGS